MALMGNPHEKLWKKVVDEILPKEITERLTAALNLIKEGISVGVDCRDFTVKSGELSVHKPCIKSSK